MVQWGEVVRELMIEEIDARRMPLSPVTMTDAERETLMGWLHAGAPATTPQNCAEPAAADAGADSSADAVAAESGPLVDPDAGADAPADVSPGNDASDDGSTVDDAGIE